MGETGQRGEAPARARGPARPEPWGRRAGAPPGAPAIDSAERASSGATSAPLGIERRLVRRAEILWSRLAKRAHLPGALAAHAFEAEPFADHAVHLGWPGAGRPLAGAAPLVLRVGRRLGRMAAMEYGFVTPDKDEGAELGQRLAAFGRDAVLAGRPLRLEYEGCPPGSERRLMMRAIALPFGAEGAGPVAVVIVTWREVLAPDECAELTAEVERALTALKRGGRANA